MQFIESFFLQFAENYIGVDWSNTPHDLKADIVANLNEKLPIDSEVADTAISISVLEHLYNPKTMLNEAYRILRPNGKLILQVPWQWWIHEAPYDYHRYTPYALEKMLEEGGFNEIEIEPTSGFFSMWLIKFNYFTRRFIYRSTSISSGMLKLFFIPIWHINQIIGPILDKLDRNWEAETHSYFIVAIKK